ncbi:MAG: tetratricopeptide repeat protein, partial [Planctomycetes bacterium]|nr:tetratricopeptide repeat protein [Planctomycetota bacterium]
TALRRERDLAAAAASLESAEALGPRLPAVQLEAAWQQLAQGEGEAALRAFARLLEREPLLAAAHYGRAACLYELGSLADALTGFERAWELERSRRHALWVGRLRARLGDAQGAIEAFDFALERDLPARALPGESEAEVLIDRARARFLLEDYAACEADCSRSLERSPDAALAHLFRGRARDKLARPSEAEPDLRRAVELDPDNPGFLDELVHHHQLAGDTAKQLELAGDGVARFPTHAHLRFDRATAHYTRGDVGLALADFDNLVERGENLPLGVQFRVRERRAELRAISGTHDAGEDLAVLMRLGRDRAARTQAHLVAARVSSILGAPRHALAVLAPLEDGGASDPLRLERIRARLVGGEFLAAQEELLPFRAQTSHPDAGGYAALQLAALGELEALEGLAPERWTGRLAAFLRGEGTVAALLRDARAEDQPWSTGYTPRERACEAHYYVALQLDARGALDAARAHYRACVGCGVVAFNEFQLALGRLRFLARR